MARKPNRSVKSANPKAKDGAALRALAPIAKTINSAWERATKAEGQFRDARLECAIALAGAKAQCGKSKINFKEWLAGNCHLAWETARKLAAIGEAPDPRAALENKRAETAASVAKSRDKAKAAPASAGRTAQQEPFTASKLMAAASELPKATREQVALSLIGQDREFAPKGAAALYRASQDAPADAIVRLWGMCNEAERRHVCQRLGLVSTIASRVAEIAPAKSAPAKSAPVAIVAGVDTGDIGDIPAFLDKRGGKAVTPKVPATRATAKAASKAHRVARVASVTA